MVPELPITMVSPSRVSNKAPNSSLTLACDSATCLESTGTESLILNKSKLWAQIGTGHYKALTANLQPWIRLWERSKNTENHHSKYEINRSNYSEQKQFLTGSYRFRYTLTKIKLVLLLKASQKRKICKRIQITRDI